MSKFSDDYFLEGTPARIAECTTLLVCSGTPATVAAANSAALASATLTAGFGNGSYTVGAGDVSGRKVTIAQQSNLDIDASGDAETVVVHDGTNIYRTTCESQVLTEGGTVTVPAWDAEIPQAT